MERIGTIKAKKKQSKERPAVLIPLVLGIALTVVTQVLDLDRTFARYFHDAASGDWAWDGRAFERVIFRLSPVPSILFFAGGLVVALGSIKIERWKKWARPGVHWALCMLLGPGLVVNAIFKEFYGRPRPKQSVEFGGTMEYRAAWVPGKFRTGDSFPCGHASIGFYYMAGYFVFHRRNRKAAWAWMALGLASGAFIGLARMAKGGHWFSDVVWAAVFVYYTSYLSAWICRLDGFRGKPVA